MAVVTQLQPDEREVPHEPGCWFSFRLLTGAEMDKLKAAREQVQFEAATRAAQMMKMRSEFEDLLKNVAPDALAEAQKIATEGAEDAGLEGFDPALLVQFGLVAWRGKHVGEGADYEGLACDDATKAQLDDRTRLWAARQVKEINTISEGEALRSVPGGVNGDGAGAPLPTGSNVSPSLTQRS